MCLFDQDPSTRRRSSGFVAISMVCLTLAVLWQDTPLAHGSHLDLRDFIDGLLYGLSFGFSIGALFLARRSRFNR